MATLEDACRRFSFDQDGDLLADLAGRPLVAIQDAIDIYAAKQRLGSLPPDVGLRYFAGIVRNCQSDRELHLYEDELVDQLLRTRHLVLDHLKKKAQAFAELETTPRLMRIV